MLIHPLPQLWMRIRNHCAPHARHFKQLDVIPRVPVDQHTILGSPNYFCDLQTKALPVVSWHSRSSMGHLLQL